MHSSTLKAHFNLLSRYNKWAHGVLCRALRSVDKTKYYEDCGLAFGSMHGTMNHLLLADSLWYMRMRGLSDLGGRSVHEVSGYWNSGKTRWNDVTPGLEELEEQLMVQCDRWVEFVGALTDEQLTERFFYKNTRGDPLESLLAPTLDHVFNHGTHHRGQVSAAITQCGHEAPVMDLIYFFRDSA